MVYHFQWDSLIAQTSWISIVSYIMFLKMIIRFTCSQGMIFGTISQTVTLGMCTDSILWVHIFSMFTLPFLVLAFFLYGKPGHQSEQFRHYCFTCTHMLPCCCCLERQVMYSVFFPFGRHRWMWITCVWGAVCQHAREFPLLLWRQTGQEARAWPE